MHCESSKRGEGCSVSKGKSWSPVIQLLGDVCGAQALSLVTLARGNFCSVALELMVRTQFLWIPKWLTFQKVIKCLCQIPVWVMEPVSFANLHLKILISFAGFQIPNEVWPTRKTSSRTRFYLPLGSKTFCQLFPKNKNSNIGIACSPKGWNLSLYVSSLLSEQIVFHTAFIFLQQL